ncbi:MAG: hypothetical protein ABJA70_13455, partial [Chryseolinea sp.]
MLLNTAGRISAKQQSGTWRVALCDGSQYACMDVQSFVVSGLTSSAANISFMPSQNEVRRLKLADCGLSL